MKSALEIWNKLKNNLIIRSPVNEGDNSFEKSFKIARISSSANLHDILHN